MQLGVDDFGVADDRRGVADFGIGVVRRGAADANRPTFFSGWKIDSVRALITGGGLAVERSGDDRHVVRAVRGKLDDIVHGETIGVAVAVLLEKRRRPETQAHTRQLQVAQALGPWLRGLQFNADRMFGLYRRKAGDVFLIVLAEPLLPGHAGEVHRTIGALNRCLVQINGPSTVDQANNRPFADGVQNVRVTGIDQAVRAFYRRVAAFAAFGAANDGVGHWEALTVRLRRRCPVKSWRNPRSSRRSTAVPGCLG